VAYRRVAEVVHLGGEVVDGLLVPLPHAPTPHAVGARRVVRYPGGSSGHQPPRQADHRLR